MKDVQAILFCGGKGKRLFPVTNYYQKVMMPIGDNGAPILEYIIRHLKYHGISKYIALIGYRSNQIKRFFGDGSRFDVSIDYVIDNDNIRGTGAALLNAQEIVTEKRLLIYYTDILSNIDVSELLKFHQSHNKVGSIWSDPNWQLAQGIINHDKDMRITKIVKAHKAITANTGISMLSSRVFNYLEEFTKNDNGLVEIDLSSDIYPRLVEEKQVSAFIHDDWWMDLGNLLKYKAITNKLLLTRYNHIINEKGEFN
ncbi:MAG: nucleotidyltransferase family protein [Candidatus Kariarchaeaceae archaeon]|jgi:NDP-sugar pyrophosphorylase family protein